MGSSLAHVMVVGGTRAAWASIDNARWGELAAGLGDVVAAAGGSWLTLRAYEDGALSAHDAPAERRRHVVEVGECTVLVDPLSDGRERFAEAMRRLPPAAPVDEKAIAAVLYAPADIEPDLVVVLGPSTRLPPSLVWELAYGELVFEPVGLADFRPADLRRAIEDFQGRSRRFGGLEP